MADKPRQTRTKPTALIPPEGDPGVGKAVFDCVEKIIKDKDEKGLSWWWKRSYELIRNKFWKQSSDKYVLATANLTYTHHERVVNQLTDHEPTFNIIPIGEGVDDQNEDKYDTMLKSADYWWRETEQQDTYDDSVRNGEMYGTPIEKYVFNPDLSEGLGDAEAIPIDPFHFGFWPLNAKKASKCQAMFHYRPMTVSEVKGTWKDKAKDVISDKQLLDKLGEERRGVNPLGNDAHTKGYSATFSGTAKMISNRNADGKEDEEDLVVVAECWVFDHTRVSESTEVDGKRAEKSSLKYKGGIRRIVTCNMGDVILSDEDNPSINPNIPEELARMTYLYHNLPFGVSASIKDTTTLWGRTILEQLYPLQADINVTLTQLKTLKDKSARRKLVNPKTSGVSSGQLTNATGIIEPTNSIEGQGIHWLNDPGIPADLVSHLEMLKGLFFLVSGAFDMDQASIGGQEVVAYKAINALLERSAQINRDRQRNYDKLLRIRGRAFLSLMQNWYTEERFISYEKDGKTQSLKVKGPDLIVPAKLMVVSGSTLPISISQRREEAVMLFDKGLIDDQECLKRLDYPDYMNVITRKRQGAYGELLRRLGIMGVPEQILGVFNEIATMDVKDFTRAAETGKLPSFPALIQAAQGKENPKDIVELQKGQAEASELVAKAQKSQADAQKSMAEVKKVEAEIQLIIEKMRSEVFGRMVQAEGVKLDWKKLDQEAAKIVNDMEIGRKSLNQTAQESFMKGNDQGPFRDRSLKSDNLEVAT
jgi:hypothetical protein